jgi:D-sedoheptulose 7-phosphate isomerase
MREIISLALSEAASALANLQRNTAAIAAMQQAAELMAASLRNGGKIISCGNGGSHCDAMHFAEELSGRFRDNRKPLAAIAISDPAHMSCTANDFGFDHIFSRFVDGLGRRGDVLLAISTSGTSKNILKAAEAAKAVGMKVVSLTGKEPGSAVAKLADVDICTPGGSKYSDRIQELHIKVIHILVELIERQLCQENYK